MTIIGDNALTNDKMDIIIEKLNLSRLDSLMLNGLLLPLSIMSVGLIISWILNPFPIISIAHILAVVVMWMFITLFSPLFLYAYAYLSDNLEKRIRAIQTFLKYAIFVLLVSAAAGFLQLYEFVESYLPAYERDLSRSFSISFILFLLFVFGGLYPMNVLDLHVSMRLRSWLESSIPMRLEREAMRLNRILKPPYMSPKLFKIFSALTTVTLTMTTVLWWVAFYVSSSLTGLWKIPFFFGCMFFPVFVVWLLLSGRRLYRSRKETVSGYSDGEGKRQRSNCVWVQPLYQDH